MTRHGQLPCIRAPWRPPPPTSLSVGLGRGWPPPRPTAHDAHSSRRRSQLALRAPRGTCVLADSPRLRERAPRTASLTGWPSTRVTPRMAQSNTSSIVHLAAGEAARRLARPCALAHRAHARAERLQRGCAPRGTQRGRPRRRRTTHRWQLELRRRVRRPRWRSQPPSTDLHAIEGHKRAVARWITAYCSAPSGRGPRHIRTHGPRHPPNGGGRAEAKHEHLVACSYMSMDLCEHVG